MNQCDICQRFLINENGVRGHWTLLEGSFQTVLAKHDYPLELQALLGELMAAATLLTATLKYEGSMTIQARGTGIVSLLTVECTHNQALRAIARWQGDTRDQDFKTLLGDATLAITISPEKGERYQGIVPLDGRNLAECLERYFSQSEQLTTHIQLFHGNNRAGGLMLQVLPPNSETPVDPDQQAEDWRRITLLANTVTADEFLNLDCSTLLHRLFHEELVELFQTEPVQFHCSCSRQRLSAALISLGKAELEQALTEQGNLDITCEFCNQQYQFDRVDIALLFKDNVTPNGSGQNH